MNGYMTSLNSTSAVQSRPSIIHRPIMIGAILLSAVGLVATPWLIGSFLAEKHTYTRSQTYDISADQLFFIAVNIDDWPNWRRDIDGVIHRTQDDFEADLVRGEERLTYAFSGDFEQLFFHAKFISDDVSGGGSWTFQVEEGSNKGSILTVTEHGFISPPSHRFFSLVFSTRNNSIDRFFDDLDLHLRAASTGAIPE